jgi:hypothetical protein
MKRCHWARIAVHINASRALSVRRAITPASISFQLAKQGVYIMVVNVSFASWINRTAAITAPQVLTN